MEIIHKEQNNGTPIKEQTITLMSIRGRKGAFIAQKYKCYDFTNLRREISPFCNTLVVYSYALNSSQDDILGNLHPKTFHTRNKDIGVLHAFHRIMAQHVTTERVREHH